VPSPSAAPGLALGTPLTGEFAVTANMDDRSLSVVPIGLARALPPFPVDVAPTSVGTWSNTSRAVTADSAHTVSSVDLAKPTATGDIDVGGAVHVFSANGQGTGPLVLVSDSDDTLRTLDPSSGALGAAVALGPGPHAVAFGPATPNSPAQIFVANAADGSVSVLDGAGTAVQNTLSVGGQPIGIAVTPRNRLWIADGSANDVYEFDPSTGRGGRSIEVGAGLQSLAATADAHYLVLGSSDPDHALYSVDLYKLEIGQAASAVNSLAVPSGVLAVATGAETTLAYATTGDNQLIYWDLVDNNVSRSVAVGRKPVGLSLGLVMPNNLIPPVAQVGGGGGTSGGGGSANGGAAPASASGANTINSSAGPGSTAPASTGASSTGPSSTGPSSGAPASSTAPGSATGPASSTAPSSATGLASSTGPSSSGPSSTAPSSTGPASTGPSSASRSSSGSSSTAPAANAPASTGPAQPATTGGTGGSSTSSNTTGSRAPSIGSISTIGNSTSGGASATGGTGNGAAGTSGASAVGGTSGGAGAVGGNVGGTSPSAGTTSAGASGGTGGGTTGATTVGGTSGGGSNPVGGTTTNTAGGSGTRGGANTGLGGARGANATPTATPRTAPATPTPSRAAAATPGPSPGVSPRG
jgi:YVTN family beta-propeller protein